MQGCSSLTDVGVHAMGDITSLVSINLQDCTDITGEPDSPVQFRSSLVFSFGSFFWIFLLSPVHCHWYCGSSVFACTSDAWGAEPNAAGLTGEGFRSWGQLLHLTSISIQNGWRVNDNGLETLGCCQAPLRHLNMKGCRLVSDAGLAALVMLSHLTHLSLQVSLQLSGVESRLMLGVSFWLHASIDEPMSAAFAHHCCTTCAKNCRATKG